MLQKLNERIQGMVAWLVIVLIAITFTLFGVDYYLQSHQTSNAKVIVNDQPISNQAYEVQYRRTRAQQDMNQMTAADEKNLQAQVLNQLINNAVTVQAAHRYGFGISKEQADAAIVQIPQFQEDGHFSTNKYQQALNNALFTPETFQSEVKQGMLLNQQRFAFIGSSFALPSEIKRFVRLYMQTRNYDYLTIPSGLFEKSIKISEDKINEYYNQHKQAFMTPEEVSVDYVILSMSDIRSNLKISEEDVKGYYEENKANFLSPAQWQVAHILFAIPEQASQEEAGKIESKANAVYNQLKDHPEQFESLVASVSDDKLSKADKGVLPWITAGQNEYSSNFSELTNPGQITKPIKTKHGYELFKLIAYKPVSSRSLAEVATMIKEQLATDKAQTQYTQTLEQLSDLSYQMPDNLNSVADKLKLKIMHSKPFSRLKGDTPFTQNKQIISAAFSHDVLQLGNNSEPLQLDNNSVVVLRVNKHIPTKKQSLEEVHSAIENILVKTHAQTKAQDLGSALVAADELTQEQLLKTNNLKWNAVNDASRDYDKVHAQINELAFNLAKPENRNGVVLENGDYVVVRLKKINNGKLSALDLEHRNSLVQQIESSYGMIDYDLYVTNLINQAKVEKH